MRSVFAVSFLSAFLAAGLAGAAQCPRNPDGLGTSRVLVIDPNEPLNDLEPLLGQSIEVEGRLHVLPGLGGTWTFYPESYQTWFVTRCFDALNDFGARPWARGDSTTNGSPIASCTNPAPFPLASPRPSRRSVTPW